MLHPVRFRVIPIFLILASCQGPSRETSETKKTQPQPQPVELIVDVPAIAGKTQSEVTAVLGAPTRCETVSPARVGKSLKCIYKGERIEVVFIADKADWITINELSAVKFSPTALDSFNLPQSNPDTRNGNVIRWSNVNKLKEVSLFPGQGSNADYLYVKAATD